MDEAIPGNLNPLFYIVDYFYNPIHDETLLRRIYFILYLNYTSFLRVQYRLFEYKSISLRRLHFLNVLRFVENYCIALTKN